MKNISRKIIALTLSLTMAVVGNVVLAEETRTVTTTANDGVGSLRKVIELATEGDTIEFAIPTTDSGYNAVTEKWKIELDSEIAFAKGLTINGDSKIILDGKMQRRIFNKTGTADLTLSGLTIQNGKSSSGGGVYADGNITVTNCIFDSNEAPTGGGLSGSTVTATNCTFKNNEASSSGGGIYGVSPVTVTDCNFDSNRATNGGGVYGSTIITINCNFESNLATNNGGGVYGRIVTATNCIFKSNRATDGGGGAYVGTSSCSITATDCIFENNKANNGGGIQGSGTYSNYPVNITATDCIFKNNEATNLGGGVYGTHAIATTDCNFDSNRATNGGGIYGHTYSTATAINSMFTGNITTTSTNGTIHTLNGTNNHIYLYHSTIAKNTGAGVRSGATIYAYNSIISGNSGAQTIGTVSTDGVNLISGVNSVTDSDIFGTNMPNSDGIIYLISTPTTDGAIPLTVASVYYGPSGLSKSQIVARVANDIMGNERPTSNVTFGAVKSTNGEVVSIEVINNPNKVQYKYGDELDLSGGLLNVCYDNGKKTQINMTDENITANDATSTIGNSKVILTYTVEEEEFTTEFLITVAKLMPTLTVADKSGVINDEITLDGTNADGLPIVYTSSVPDIASISGNKLTLNKAGSAEITATIAESDYYLATTATFNVTIGKLAQNITVGNYNKVMGDSKFVINATALGNASLKFASNNPNITVDENTGEVTILGVGTATVTISAEEGDSYLSGTATCTITVVEQKISLDKSTAKLVAGQKLQLKATANPTGKVTWKTSNDKVATVSTNGNITAKKKGTVTITATVNGKSATCKVTVLAKTITLKAKIGGKTKAIKLSKWVNLKVKKSLTLIPKANFKTGFKFKSNKPKIATVNKKGKVIAKKKGKVNITITAGGVKIKCKIKVVK